MKIIGRIWSDDGIAIQDVEVNSDPINVDNSGDTFTKVLSKSHKKKQKKARRQAQRFSAYNTRYRADSQSLEF